MAGALAIIANAVVPEAVALGMSVANRLLPAAIDGGANRCSQRLAKPLGLGAVEAHATDRSGGSPEQ